MIGCIFLLVNISCKKILLVFIIQVGIILNQHSVVNLLIWLIRFRRFSCHSFLLSLENGNSILSYWIDFMFVVFFVLRFLFQASSQFFHLKFSVRFFAGWIILNHTENSKINFFTGISFLISTIVFRITFNFMQFFFIERILTHFSTIFSTCIKCCLWIQNWLLFFFLSNEILFILSSAP